MEPFPWAPLILLMLVSTGFGAWTYCLWHEIGPRRWYEKGKMPISDSAWPILASPMLPITVGFYSLAVVGSMISIRKRVHDTAHNHILLAIQVAGGVVLALSILTVGTIVYLGKPQSLIPPTFRGRIQGGD